MVLSLSPTIPGTGQKYLVASRCSPSSYLAEGLGGFRADGTSDLLEAIADIFSTHIKIFVPERDIVEIVGPQIELFCKTLLSTIGVSTGCVAQLKSGGGGGHGAGSKM